jgi:putative transposase
MPRSLRSLQQGHWYHILNRSIRGDPLFFERSDYWAFTRLVVKARRAYGIQVPGYCLMPNHFHLVLSPQGVGTISEALQWIQTAYAARFRAKYKGFGHVFQGRFKSFPIQTNDHFLTVLRYVERNPVRANLVKKVDDWKWSSAWWRGKSYHWLDPSPIEMGLDWEAYVNTPQTLAEVEALRRSVNRGSPFGTTSWRIQTAEDMGLSSTLRSRGRPRVH